MRVGGGHAGAEPMLTHVLISVAFPFINEDKPICPILYRLVPSIRKDNANRTYMGIISIKFFLTNLMEFSKNLNIYTTPHTILLI
jgi:hypothetical protein